MMTAMVTSAQREERFKITLILDHVEQRRRHVKVKQVILAVSMAICLVYGAQKDIRLILAKYCAIQETNWGEDLEG